MSKLKMSTPTNKVVKYYTIIISLLPILSIYYSGIPGVNLGELILIFFLLYSFIVKSKVNYNSNKVDILLLFGWYITFFTFFTMFIDSTQIIDVIIRTVRFIFYLFVIYYLSKKFFSLEYASKLIKYVSLFATFYILIQNICYKFFGIILKGFLPFIPVYTSQYENLDYASLYETIFYRPTSFFLEPAHYSQYALISLVIFLFKGDFNVKSILGALFVTLGIILSTSGQGLIIASCVWLIYMLHLIFALRQSNWRRVFGLILPFGAITTLPFILKSEIVQNNVSRILSDGSNTAVSARSQGYLYFIDSNLYIKIFGAGFGNTPQGVWFSGLSYIMYCSGIIGFFILLLIFTRYFFLAKNRYTKMLIIVSLSLSVSAEIINSYWIVFTFSLFCYSNQIYFNEDNIGKETEVSGSSLILR